MARKKLGKFRLHEDDVIKSQRNAGSSAHNMMMNETSVRGGALRNKKAYKRHDKHKNNWVQR